MQLSRLTAAQRNYIEILRDRRQYLRDREVEKNVQEGKPSHRRRQEISALDWVLEVMDLLAAEAMENPTRALEKQEETIQKRSARVTDAQLRELREAGWVQNASTGLLWKAPWGKLYANAYSAYQAIDKQSPLAGVRL